MACDLITSWEIELEKVETVTDFIFLGSNITADGDCSHEIIQKMLAPQKESYDKTGQHIKSRDIAQPTKVHIVKAMVFPIVMYGCESWTIRRLSAEELMLLNYDAGEDLRVPWTARRLNQLILKATNPEYSLEGLMLKLQYFGHLM